MKPEFMEMDSVTSIGADVTNFGNNIINNVNQDVINNNNNENNSNNPIEPNYISNSLSVLDFYSEKTVFITGTTGFVGKVLLEKILRQTDVKRIYVLIRSKHSLTSQQRLETMLQHSFIFKNYSQDKLDKIKAIDGDITADHLGISQTDRDRLIEEVNVVFHSAASIVFTGVLKNFIKQNIQAVDSIMDLCSKMRHLDSVVHVSTAYGNCHLKEIEEKVYSVDPTAKSVDSYLDEIIKNYYDQDLKEGHKVLANRPNPYTWSKSVAEWLIQDRYSSLPVIICRPSIVSNADLEPVPGWCDSISGYSGLTCLCGVGIARQLIVRMDKKTDIIPVDFVINSLVVCAAYRASPFYSSDRQVVHLVTSTANPITWKQMLDYSLQFENTIPTIKQVRPVCHNVENRYETTWDQIRYHMNQIFNHYLFALIFDLICLVCGYQPFMMKLTKRMHKSLDEVKYFSMREWKFQYRNNLHIYGLVKEKERKQFRCDVREIDWPKYCLKMCLGCREFLLKDPPSTIEQAIKRKDRLYLAFNFFNVIKYLILYALAQLLLSDSVLSQWKLSTIGLPIPLSVLDLLNYLLIASFLFYSLQLFRNKFNPNNSNRVEDFRINHKLGNRFN